MTLSSPGTNDSNINNQNAGHIADLVLTTSLEHGFQVDLKRTGEFGVNLLSRGRIPGGPKTDRGRTTTIKKSKLNDNENVWKSTTMKKSKLHINENVGRTTSNKEEQTSHQ